MTVHPIRTVSDARARADRIRAGVRVILAWREDVIAAWLNRDDRALGYASWADYIHKEFDALPRLEKCHQDALISLLAGVAMPQREIAATVGVKSAQTVSNRLSKNGQGPRTIAAQEKKQELDRTSEGRKKRAEQIRHLAAQGYARRQMPQRIGISEGAIRLIIRDFDIDVPADRAIQRTRRLESNRIVSHTVDAITGLAIGVALINYDELAPADLKPWADSLKDSMKALSQFTEHIKEAAHGRAEA